MAGSPAGTGKNSFETLKDWCIHHPQQVLALLTIFVLTPFLAKSFNIDDPLFIWAAKQIQSHPGNPYGFNVNWYGFNQPMWVVTQNPPLMAYYLAVMAKIFGWSEIGLHFACLLPAVAAVVGTYRLARHFCRWPGLAAVTMLFAPGFLISSTTIMSDVPMLALWVWAVVFWVEGLGQSNFWKLSAAGILVGLAVLTKYNGICLIPLLAVYGWLKKQSAGRWLFFLLIPVAMLGVQEWLTFHLYGSSHFLASNQYAKSARHTIKTTELVKFSTTLAFTGGCFAAALFGAPFLWRKGTLALLSAGATLLLVVFLAGGAMEKNYDWLAGNHRIFAAVELFIWSAGGMSLLVLAIADVWQKRDASSWLLALWVGGTVVFVIFVYWMVNGRALLPLVPAAAILFARRLEKSQPGLPAGISLPIMACAALSLLTAQADFQQACSARKSAELICTRYATVPGRLWFEGHWGFQYYMESFGAWPLDSQHLELQSGDILVIPSQSSNTAPPDQFQTTLLTSFEIPNDSWFATMNPAVGAGFYSSLWGPLPFALGCIPPEKFPTYLVRQPSVNPH